MSQTEFLIVKSQSQNGSRPDYFPLLGSSAKIKIIDCYGPNLSSNVDIPVSIEGKIKDCNVYVVLITSSYYIVGFIEKLGMPNRHLELEWGRFKGIDCEFIISGEFLEPSE